MKKILFVMSVAILMALFSAPSFVKANTAGQMVVKRNDVYEVIECIVVFDDTSYLYVNSGLLKMYLRGDVLYYDPDRGYYNSIREGVVDLYSIYFPGLCNTDSITFNHKTVLVYSNIDDFEDGYPDELKPSAWDDFYEWFYDHFGYYPRDDSIIGLLRKLFEGDHSEDTEVTFPTLTPTPTPTPTPSPIPVQTIFVPDGNGNTTIIYQYPDPTTGVITQSPYNPNIENNITVNCDCDGGGSGGSDNPFKPVSNDPYSMDASLFWADGFGVQMSDNPLSSTDDNQKTLKAAAEEYTSSVEVLSNSFNIIPFKWLELIGLAGGILIIAGLIKTFLGG